MKITSINDPYNLIHSASLIKLSDCDYKFIMRLAVDGYFVFQDNDKLIVHKYTRYNTLNRGILTAIIHLSNCDNFNRYVFQDKRVFSIIFDNAMKTKQCDIISTYENGELKNE